MDNTKKKKMESKPLIILVKDYWSKNSYSFGVMQYNGEYWMDDGELYSLDVLEGSFVVVRLPDKKSLEYLVGGIRNERSKWLGLNKL